MTDGIDGIAGANAAVSPKKAQQSQQKVESVTRSDSGSDGSDVVNLTSTAETLNALKKEMGDAAPVDRQKVEAIKRALASGEYQPDPERVAQKFLEIEQALGKL
ncbi:MAG: flagellar biosynthesis anti-sigma factor FlgM [Gammaproteobacteria bacterium]|nr:flagellar biosynthesis anti-sigma factor FlgM [Gammaproteobacteria bacterium]